MHNYSKGGHPCSHTLSRCSTEMAAAAEARGGGGEENYGDRTRNELSSVHTYPVLFQPCNGRSCPLHIASEHCLVRIGLSQVSTKAVLPSTVHNETTTALPIMCYGHERNEKQQGSSLGAAVARGASTHPSPRGRKGRTT